MLLLLYLPGHICILTVMRVERKLAPLVPSDAHLHIVWFPDYSIHYHYLNTLSGNQLTNILVLQITTLL